MTSIHEGETFLAWEIEQFQSVKGSLACVDCCEETRHGGHEVVEQDGQENPRV